MLKMSIHEAIAKGNTENIKERIAETKDLNAKDSSGYTPLIIAARNGNVQWVNALIAAGVDLEVPSHSDFKWTALMIAASEGNHECLNSLLRANANPKTRGTHGRNALMLAAYGGHLGCLQELIKANVNLDEKDDLIGNTALISAAKRGNTECVQALLEANANVNIMNDDKKTALMCAKDDGHVSCVAVITEYLKKQQ